MTQVQKVWLVIGVCAAITAMLFIVSGPIPQDPAYHHFSDARGWLGIPNFGDVMSNLVFLPAGLYGLWVLSKIEDVPARRPLQAFFVGVILVTAGSSYYHWAPDNWTLYWDRLPITMAFMGLTAAVIAERIDAEKGVKIALPVLLFIGVALATQWRMSEAAGAGDLRAYGLVQALPMVAIPLMVWLFPSKRALIGWRSISGAFVCYGLAKVMEFNDGQVLELLNGAMSGHSLKHLLAALAPVLIAAGFAGPGLEDQA